MTTVTPRMITLSASTDTDEQHAETYQKFLGLCETFSLTHDYVSLSSHLVDLDEAAENEVTSERCEHEHLRHDEETLNKVAQVMARHGLKEHMITDMIGDLLTAGILFREKL